MRKILLNFIFIFLLIQAFGQESNIVSNAEIIQNEYVDSINGFKVIIPDWLTVRLTEKDRWGGTMEPIDGIENAVMIVSYPSDRYKSFKKFKTDKIDQYKLGDKVAGNQIFMLKNDLGQYKNIGHAFKVQLMNGSKLYDSMWIFPETSKAYLWLIFTATPETYDINIKKFKEFLDDFELMD